MREYDCIVIGQDLYALTVALFLSRKMRRVLVVQDSNLNSYDYEKVNFKNKDKIYKFLYNRNNIATGLADFGLTYAYLDNLGLEKSLITDEITHQMVVEQDGSLKRQSNLLEDFRIYLVRNYPKNIKEIDVFFEDLERHYHNYIEQYTNMLINKDYTLTSLMIEWGDMSLYDLLSKYFSDEDLILEFRVNDFINGLDMNEVSAYSFFSAFLIGLKSGFYHLKQSYKEICEMCIKKIKLINPNAFLNSSVKEFVINKKNKIEAIIDQDNNLLYAKYFFASSDPIEFYQKYFKVEEEDLKTLQLYYPNLNSKRRINTLYLVLNTKLTDIGINDMLYYFKSDYSDEIQLVRMYNYSKGINQDLRKKEGLLCLDIAYDFGKEVQADEVLGYLYKYFPRIKKFLIAFKLGKEKKYLSMLRDEKLRKNLSINELIDVESLEHIQIFDSLFVGGNFIRPEAKFYGVINQGIVYADKIEDRLYYGDSKDDFEYISNDEIMMMIRHNYQHQFFGNKEIHVNFHIGKSIYFIRTKGKNIVVHHGRYNSPDLSIYAANDKLSDLLLKKASFSQSLESGFVKYRGDIDLLFTAVKAFQLDDYQKYSPEDYLISKFKFFGVKLFFAHIFIYSIAAFLSNFYSNIYIFPIAFVLTLIISIIKFKIYESVDWFGIVLNVGLLAFSLLSVFSSWFNTMLSDDIFLAFIIITLLLSVFINNPVVYLYHQYDMNIDYRNTKLFKIITSGLTFIWAFIFLVILIGTYLTGNNYLSMFYSFLFFGILITYYYPVIYVKTSIKK